MKKQSKKNKKKTKKKKEQNICFSTNLAKKDDIPLVSPKLNINNSQITRAESIKFLHVFLEKSLSQKTHKMHRK